MVHTNKTPKGRKATHIAVMNGNFNVLNKLIKYASDIDAIIEGNQNTITLGCTKL